MANIGNGYAAQQAISIKSGRSILARKPQTEREKSLAIIAGIKASLGKKPCPNKTRETITATQTLLFTGALCSK